MKKVNVGMLSLGVLVFFLISTIILTITLGTQKLDPHSQASFDKNEADVIVAGAGSGGVVAAIQAARAGASVILLEETDWVGGQMTAAGVTSMDGGDPAWTGGIYKEFIDKVKNHYKVLNKSISTCYWNQTTTCFEPSVGQQIITSMINAQPNISLRLKTQIISAQKSGNTITSLTIKKDNVVSLLKAKVFIDATEYGDLLPLVDAAYRSGNSINTSLNESACIQDITYTAVMKKYPDGVPNNLKITIPPPGYTKEREDEFASIVTKDGYNEGFNGTYPVSWAIHNAYRGMPDSSNPTNYTAWDPAAITKTGVNWANDFPVNVRYLEDKTYRKLQNCEAKLKTIQFIYYVQNILGESLWSVANDEGYDTSYNREENNCAIIPDSLKSIEQNMPVIPYVRESRRAIGSFTLTAKDIYRSGTPPKATKTFSNSIAVGDYPVDLHNCKAEENLESDLETLSDKSRNGPFQIPIETLFSNNIDNLILAEKNLSQSRLANGATRLQPITMLTGQAAGAVAALAVKWDIVPKQVPVRQVQRLITESKAHIVPFLDVSVNDPTFSSVQQIAARGIMIGIGNLLFAPNDVIKRNQMAAVLSKAFSIPKDNPTTATFIDVPITDSFFPYIQGIYKAGMTAGCSTTSLEYCPTNALTNAELGVFALRGWQRTNNSIQPVPTGYSIYSDLSTTHWGFKYAEGLSKAGLLWYCDETAKKFCPDEPVSRKQVSFVLNTILNYQDFLATPTIEPIPSSTLSITALPTITSTLIPIPTLIPSSTPTQTPIPTPTQNIADLDNNGKVTIIDYVLFMQYWWLNTIDKGDLNGDGKLSVIDYTVFMNGWHQSR